MSRDKFEAWCKECCLNSKTRQANHLFAAWLAGRESMRDEAAALLQDGHASWLAHHEASQLVAGIEP